VGVYYALAVSPDEALIYCLSENSDMITVLDPNRLAWPAAADHEYREVVRP
jgi:hypothetical protein